MTLYNLEIHFLFLEWCESIYHFAYTIFKSICWMKKKHEYQKFAHSIEIKPYWTWTEIEIIEFKKRSQMYTNTEKWWR